MPRTSQAAPLPQYPGALAYVERVIDARREELAQLEELLSRLIAARANANAGRLSIDRNGAHHHEQAT